jgi:hypothetical protein
VQKESGLFAIIWFWQISRSQMAITISGVASIVAEKNWSFNPEGGIQLLSIYGRHYLSFRIHIGMTVNEKTQ